MPVKTAPQAWRNSCSAGPGLVRAGGAPPSVRKSAAFEPVPEGLRPRALYRRAAGRLRAAPLLWLHARLLRSHCGDSCSLRTHSHTLAARILQVGRRVCEICPGAHHGPPGVPSGSHRGGGWDADGLAVAYEQRDVAAAHRGPPSFERSRHAIGSAGGPARVGPHCARAVKPHTPVPQSDPMEGLDDGDTQRHDRSD